MEQSGGKLLGNEGLDGFLRNTSDGLHVVFERCDPEGYAQKERMGWE
jgi:hypothetical protein